MSEIRTVDFQPGLSAKCVIKFNRLPDDLLYTALRSIPFRDGARDGSRFMRDTLGKEGRKSSEAPYLLRGVPARAGGSKGNRKQNSTFEPRAGSKILRKGFELPSPLEAGESPVWRAPWKPRSASNNAKKLYNAARTYSPNVPKAKGYFGRTATFNVFGVSLRSIPTKASDSNSAGCIFASRFGAKAVRFLATLAKRSVFSLVSCPPVEERFAVYGLNVWVRSLQPATNSLLVQNAHKDGPQATRICEAWEVLSL